MKCLKVEADCKYQLKIEMLDGSEMDYEITDETLTQDLLDLVFKQLDLNENVFFGLYKLSNDNQKIWLLNNRRISSQILISSSKSIARLNFGIKFFIEDPCKLKEESSRYQFFLQLKKDILEGKLEVPFDLCARLFAYALQSELGDYDSEMHKNNYASNYKFQLNQSKKLEERAEELHKGLTGKMPASVEFSFLDEVKHLEFFGAEFFSVLTDDEEENYLVLSPCGLMILHRNNLFATYHWAHIIGVYKKGKYFMIKIFNKDNEKTTYGFELRSKKGCKNLWRICVEYQLFYKLIQSYFENSDSAVNSQTSNQGRLTELTERFRAINLNDLMNRRRKTMYSIFQTLMQHVNGLNKNSFAKDHLKTEQLKGINFTGDETCQNNRSYDSESLPKTNFYEDASNGQNKNESDLPNGFYLVNKQQHQTKNMNSYNASNNKSKNGDINKKQNKGNILISTPGYNVESENVFQSKNRKSESVFSARTHRSRAAFSEMAYPDHRHNNKHGKNCSHRRSKESHHHKHRHQSICSHRHHRFYEDECLSADDYENMPSNKAYRRNSRSRSFHTLCEEMDHHKFKYFNDFDNEINSCIRSRSNRSHRRKHRSCCLNELCYESGHEDENDMYTDPNDDIGSLCSSMHSLTKNSSLCKRRHKHRKGNTDYKTDSCEKQRLKSFAKRSSKNMKLIDQQKNQFEIEENKESDNQSDISELSYCSHHSHKSQKYLRSCHRSKSKCCRHNRSFRCKHNHDIYNDFEHHERFKSQHRQKNKSSESLEGQEDKNGEMNKFDDGNNQERYKLKTQSNCMIYQQNMNSKTLIQPIIRHEQHSSNIQKANDQYLLPVQQFSNYENSFDIIPQSAIQEKSQQISNYNSLSYRPSSNEQRIQNFVNSQNNLPYYNTLTNNMRPVHFQQTNQIGLPPVYQPINYQLRNHVANHNGFGPVNNSQIRNELQFFDSNKKHQIYQNLQEISRVKNSSPKDIPQLPPRNQQPTECIRPPPLPSKSTKLLSNAGIINYKTHPLDKNPLYAKPAKLLTNNSLKNPISESKENDNQLNVVKQSSNNSGDSANSSLQNINNLDSGISICSSTPTQDLQSINKAIDPKTSNKSNGENDDLKNINEKNEATQSKPSNEINYDSSHHQKLDIQNKKNNNQQSLEFFEINANLNSAANRINRTVSLGEYHPVIPKFKAFEISTEL